MGHVISLIYNHRQSQPKASSVHVNDALLSFSTITSPAAIHHASPALSAWAAQLIGNEVYREIGKLTKNDPGDPNDHTQLRASTNGCGKNVHVATWEDFGKFSIEDIGRKYKNRAPLSHHLIESMAGPRNGQGQVIVWQRRPNPIVSLQIYGNQPTAYVGI